MKETVKDCRFPWLWMMVTSDGQARPCCHATGNIGNVNEASIDEIWNGEKIVTTRESILRNEIPAICTAAACKFVQNMIND